MKYLKNLKFSIIPLRMPLNMIKFIPNPIHLIIK